MNKFSKVEILTLSALLSACSILYELMLANVLSLLTGNQVLWQAVTIAVYVGGLGFGAYWSEKIKEPLKYLVRVEFLISILGGVSLLLIYFVHGVQNFSKFLLFIASGYSGGAVIGSELGFELSYLAITQMITLAIGILTGLELPILLKISEENSNEKVKEGEVLGANYFGTLFGTICFSFWMKPNFDLLNSAVLTASLNYLILLYLVWKSSKNIFKKFFFVTFSLCFVFLFKFNNYFMSEFLKFHYYLPRFTFQDRIPKEDLLRTVLKQPEIERSKSLYQYLDFVTFNQDKKDFTFSLDQHFQFNSKNEHFYHQSFAHVPIMFSEKVPKDILVLGAGDGLLIRELNRYNEIQSITNVELDEAVINVAKNDPRVLALNKNSYSDPRVKIEIGDGFYYVRNTDKYFDAIYVDFPYPNNFDLARLYSIEIYSFLAKRLKANGYIILDAPLESEVSNNLGEAVMDAPFSSQNFETNSVLLSSLSFAGFRYLFPFEVNGETFIIASINPIHLDVDMDTSINKNMFSEEVFHLVKKIRTQQFPHEISEKHINSVFSPKIGLGRY
jgi:spermidine synthase